MTTLHGTLLQPTTAQECGVTSDAIVRIDTDGLIAEIDQGSTKSADVVGGRDCWILPGFIDAHLHLPQWDRRGIDGYSLLDWHHKIAYQAEMRMEDPAFAAKMATDFATGMIAHGTTTVAAFGSSFPKATDAAFSALAKEGLRAIYGRTLSDVNCPDALLDETDKALDQSREIAAKWHNAENGRLRYAFSPRSVTSCSEKLLRGAAALAKMIGCHVQTHVAESHSEVAAAREAFPDRLDDVEVLAEMGLLGRRTLLGHGVCLQEPQRKQVAEAGSAVIHCPTANLFLESGLMDYVAHRRAGIRMALGSSIAGGPEVYMPRVAVACLQTAKGVKVHALPRGSHQVPSPSEAWWLLTKGAAEALDWSDKIGAIEPGMEADCLVVRPVPWIADLPEEQKISALLYTIEPSQIEHVFVAGRRVGP